MSESARRPADTRRAPRARWRFLWTSVVGALFAVVFLPPAPEHVSSWLRTLLAPAEWSLRVYPVHASWFPLFAAAELLALGLLVDVCRLVWLRRR